MFRQIIFIKFVFNKFLFVKIALISFLIGFSSCNVEKKAAKSFIESKDKPALYVTFSDNWKLFLLRSRVVGKEQKYDTAFFQYDEVKSQNYKIYLADSLFKKSLKEELASDGFKAFKNEEIGNFFSSSDDKFIVEFLQMYIEEKPVPVRDTFYFSPDNFIKFDTSISSVEVLFWIRVNPVNNLNLASPLLFASFSLTDFFDGEWKYNFETDSYYYQYEFLPYNTEDLYAFFDYTGLNLASYFYDYFMNLHLHNSLKSPPKAYYSFNKKTNVLRKAGYNRFIFME
ncbi:MAG: hypothetical protein GX259_03615 [Bacteroidales bacterium]|nr:hypothetical protein [Bacteroidales bacterium]